MKKVKQILTQFFRKLPSFVEYEVLSGGLTPAQNIKVTLGKDFYVLRILDPTVSSEKRKQEILAQKLASSPDFCQILRKLKFPKKTNLFSMSYVFS